MGEPESVPVDGHRRATDRGFLCTLALRASQSWDFIDRRRIDKHVAAAAVLIFVVVSTIKIVDWGMALTAHWLDLAASGHAVAGSDVALVVGAIVAPWSVVISTVVPTTLAFYFRARGQQL